MSDSDDTTQDPGVLASAYLDGEVTSAERARVEGDPELLAEVASLRQVRAVLADGVEPAPVSVREAQLAAALDVFDQLDAAGAAAAAVTPMSAGRARRLRRNADRPSGERTRLVLGVAAGLVVLAGVGAVIRGVVVSTEDTTDDLAVATAEEPAEEPIGPSEADIAAEIVGGNTNEDAPTDIDESEVARDVLESDVAFDDEAAEEPAEEEAAAEAATPESAEPGSDDAADASFPADADGADPDDLAAAGDPPPETDLVAIATPDDLADFAAPAAYAPDSIGAGEGAEPPLCAAAPPNGLGIDRLAEPALVDGEPVLVGIDLDARVAYAFVDDCRIVLQAGIPTEEEFLATIPATPTTTESP